MSLTRMILLPVVLMVMTSCLLTSGIPRLTSNAMLWKRLGLNRGIGNERPQITSSKKKGESTVYFIKLPPQPHYYSAFNLLPTSSDQKNTPEPFETVSVDFTANGKPENVYHWNLPLGLTHPTTTTTTTTSTTTPQPPPLTSTYSPLNYKKPYRHNYYNNGKPHKLYFVKPSYRAPATTVPTAINPTTTTETPPSSSTVGFYKKLQFKKNFKGNGKPNQLYFVQPAHFSF